MSQKPLEKLPHAKSDSDRIEKFLIDAVIVDGDAEFTDITSHLVKAGGKRQRPHFTIASAASAADGPNAVSDDVVKGGVAVELVQVGSLYHDDVLDEADIRRNVDSVNARWGNVKAILAGDYLLAKASEISAGLGVEVVDLLARTISELCKGQVTELRTAYDTERTVEQYYESVEGKTAALFAAATRIGGIVAGHSPEVIELLTQFGSEYGLAFQIVDDISDLTMSDEELGKPSGNDIVEGVYSLPVIYALAGPNRDELLPLLQPELTEEQKTKALEIIRSDEGITKATEKAKVHVATAKEKILSVSTNPYATALAETADALLAGLK